MTVRLQNKRMEQFVIIGQKESQLYNIDSAKWGHLYLI